MEVQSTSQLQATIDRLIDLIRSIETQVAPATTGRCKYILMAVTVCQSGVTQATCHSLSLGTGTWEANKSCGQPFLGDPEDAPDPTEEIPPGVIGRLLDRLNELNNAYEKEPLGACSYTLDDQSQCAETTEAACTIGLQGSFSEGQSCVPLSQKSS